MLKSTGIIMFVCSLTCLALLACRGNKKAFDKAGAPHHFSELQTVSDLMYDNPLQALDSLNQWADDTVNWTVADRYEWRLRYVEALYKTHRPTESCASLSPVVSYYDSLCLLFPDDLGLRNLQVLAYYYKGVTLTRPVDDAEATRCFLSALRAMESVDADIPANRRFVALAYTRLGEILYAYGINAPARKAYAKALDGFSALGDTLAMASMIRNDAAICQNEKEYDKALSRFYEAERLDPVGDDILCHSRGCLLCEKHLYDSATPYLERSFAIGDHFARTDAAARLSDIYRQNGNFDREVYYTRYYVSSALNVTTNASTKMEIEFLCGNENGNEAEHVDKESLAQRLWLWALTAAVVAFGILVFVIVKNRRRISHIEKQITNMAELHKEETEGKDREIEIMTRQLTDTRERLKNRPTLSFDEAWNQYVKCDIVLKIKRMIDGKDLMIKNVGLYPELKLKEMDYLELMREFNKSFEGFNVRFLKDYPDLTRADLRYCALAVLGLSDVEIAVLNGVSYSGTNRRTKKILSVMQSADSIEMTLLTYLRNNW